MTTRGERLRGVLLKRYRDRPVIPVTPVPRRRFAFTFLPTKLDNCVLWLDALQINNLADGATVGTWSDLSGNSNHVTQATEALRPTFQVNEINGKPAVYTNGSSTFLQGSLTTTSPATAFVVGKYVTVGRFFDHETAGRQLFSASLTNWGIWAGAVLDGATDRSGAYFIGSGLFNGASSVVYYNGAQEAAGNAGTNAGAGDLFVGKDNSTNYYELYVAELIYYQRALSASERLQVHSYLGTKYAITVI